MTDSLLPIRRRSVSRLLVVILLVLGSDRQMLCGQDAGLRELAVESRPITTALQDDVRFLSSDELRGRSVTDDSIEIAAQHIADRMRTIGLDTTTLSGTPYQNVSIQVGSQVNSRERNFANFAVSGGEPLATNLGDGFAPLAIGQDSATASGRVLFAGYGITSKKHNYDDYANIDVKGAIVIVLRKEPGISDPNSPFDGVRNTPHAYFATKITNAIRHGAAAVLIVNDPASVRRGAQDVKNRMEQEETRLEDLQALLASLPEEAKNNRKSTADKMEGAKKLLAAMTVELDAAERGVLNVSQAGTKTRDTAKLPVASIARDVADRLLQTSGISLEAVERQIDETFRPASKDLSQVTAEVSVDLKPAVALSDNVIGILPGKGALADQVVVIGAHYDHVGMGGYASLAPGTIAVHNGADDNASGTATMLASAELLSKRLASRDDHRTVLFIAFTGEERGLIGSKYYVKNPVRPLSNTVAMINLDMVGRLRDNELTIYGTGTAGGFASLVDESNREFQFTLFKVASGYGPSDHESFYRAGIPVLFFFTGLHNDYHRPSDDFDKIDFGNLTRVTDMVSDVAFRLVVQTNRPEYSATNKNVQIRRQLTAFLGVRLTGQRGGVRVSGVTQDGPAEQAGLRVDDQIQRIGNKRVRVPDDVIAWVRAKAPGDEFEIQIVRNANSMVLRGKLERRD